MAVRYASIGTADGVTGDSDQTLVLGVPSGTVAGDLLVAVGCSNTRYMAASGWTRLTADTSVTCVLYKIATGTEGTSVTFAVDRTYSSMSAVMLRFTGARAPYLLATAFNATWDRYIPFNDFTIEENGSGVLYLGLVPVDNFTGTLYTPARGTTRYNSNFNSVSYDPIVATQDDMAVGNYPGISWVLSAENSNKRSQILIIPPAITQNRGHAQATRTTTKTQEYVRASWAQSGRALNSGTFGTPANYTEEVCKAAWENSSRTLNNQLATKYPVPVIESYSVGTLTVDADTCVTMASPAGTQAGDLLLAVFSLTDAKLVTLPRGGKWTYLTPTFHTGTCNVCVLAAVAESETASYSFITNQTASDLHGVLFRISGADISRCNPGRQLWSTDATATFNLPAPQENPSLILWCVNTANQTCTCPLTEVYDEDPGGADARALAVYSQQYTGGTLSSPTVTFGTTVSFASIGISLSAPKRVS